MSETMKTLTMGMDALAAGLRSAERRCRRSAARQGTRGRRGARIVLLDMVDICRTAAPHMGEPADDVLAGEILFYLDDVMRDTDRGRAMRWAQAQARRRARRRS